MTIYQTVRMGDFLNHRSEFFRIDDFQEYKRARVQLHGKGIVQRDTITGSKLRTKKQQSARTGEFLVAEIDAKVGGFGIVPPELDGAIVSSHYFLFEIDESICLKEWLDFFVRSGQLTEQVNARGSTNYASIRSHHVLDFEIPLPPLGEQKRVVGQIEKLVGKVEEARRLRETAVLDTNQLISSESNKVFNSLCEEYEGFSFGSIEQNVTSGPRGWKSYYSDSGYRFYRAQDIGSNGKLQHSNIVFVAPPSNVNADRAKLKPGDLMLVITGATVGRCAVFPENSEEGFVNQHVAICRLPQSQVNLHYALWGLRSPIGQAQLLGSKYGQGKPGLNLTNIRELTLPLPPLEVQNSVVQYLNQLDKKIEQLDLLQTASQEELDALLPSILDKAFNGEL